MRPTVSFIVALLAAAGNAMPTGTMQPQAKRYIIELNSQSQIAHIQSMVERTPGMHVFRIFDHAVFPAISVECLGGHDVETMTQLFGVEKRDDPGVSGIYESVCDVQLSPLPVPAITTLALSARLLVFQICRRQSISDLFSICNTNAKTR